MYTCKLEARYSAMPPRTPARRFAVTGNPRTGSSHLVSLLDSHPDIACWDDEIFYPGEAFDQSRMDTPDEFLHKRVFTVNAQAVGFKMLWDALDRFPTIWQTLRANDIDLIHVWRANRLDSFISFQLATLNAAFSCFEDGDQVVGRYRQEAFEADYVACQEWFEVTEQHEQEIRHIAQREGRPLLEIEYSELCRTQERVLQFLGVPLLPLGSKLYKQRHKSQAASITNYSQLKAHFASTRWAGYFELEEESAR